MKFFSFLAATYFSLARSHFDGDPVSQVVWNNLTVASHDSFKGVMIMRILFKSHVKPIERGNENQSSAEMKIWLCVSIPGWCTCFKSRAGLCFFVF